MSSSTPVDRDAAIARLPELYAAAIRLEDARLEGEIADRLNIERESVPALLQLAHAKLARLLAMDRATG